MLEPRIISLKAVENYLVKRYGSHIKLFPELLMLNSSEKRAAQYPLIEFDKSSLESLRGYCLRNELAIRIISDPLSKEKNILIFNEDDSEVENLMMTGDNEQRGNLFGYPQCCIKKLTQIKNSKNLFSNKNILARNGKKDLTINYLNNYFLDSSMFRLFSHLPCSNDCKHTQVISTQVLESINKLIPELHKIYVDVNKMNIALDLQSERRFLFKGPLKENGPNLIFDINFFEKNVFTLPDLNELKIVKVVKG